MMQNILKQIQEERKFLHDMANQLTILQGMSGLIQSDLEMISLSPEKEKIIDRFHKSNQSIAKMIELLKKRRSSLVKQQEEIEENHE